MGSLAGRRLMIGLALALFGAGAAVIGTSTSEEPPDRPTGMDMDMDMGMGMDARAGTGRFAYLAEQDSNYCSLDPDTVMGYADDQHMQGSCCNPMDPDRYRQQIEGLKRYAHIPEVPQDPYDIDAGLAQQLLEFDETVVLDEQDQATFDAAMAMTEDGGPCCCQCWRWYMTSGLAK